MKRNRKGAPISAVHDRAATARELPADRAFVLRIDLPAQPPDRLAARVEHIR